MCIDNYSYNLNNLTAKCEDCSHGGVCKHRENYHTAIAKAKAIEDEISPKLLSPISIEAKCRSFEPKPKVRNGYSLGDLKGDLK